jgi:hypothetical protein
MRPNSTSFCPMCGKESPNHRPSKPRTYCSRACYWQSLRSATVAERFWSKVDTSGECWLWTGAINPTGYGALGRGVNSGAHRVSWQLHYGEIPPGMEVCHRCDVRSCVRPDHLFLGPHADNAADMVRKGRQAQGERAARAKLTCEQVKAIRARWASGHVSQPELASEYGVSRIAIQQILYGKTWRGCD